MFILTEEAKQELQKRLNEHPKRFVRLQMRHSCFLKLKLTLEDASGEDDVHVTMDGIDFIIDKNHVHYIRNKKIDFIPDATGFKQFEAV
jgi:Fe-S cluster assembly iron-binding protein IscA